MCKLGKPLTVFAYRCPCSLTLLTSTPWQPLAPAQLGSGQLAREMCVCVGGGGWGGEGGGRGRGEGGGGRGEGGREGGRGEATLNPDFPHSSERCTLSWPEMGQ